MPDSSQNAARRALTLFRRAIETWRPYPPNLFGMDWAIMLLIVILGASSIGSSLHDSVPGRLWTISWVLLLSFLYHYRLKPAAHLPLDRRKLFFSISATVALIITTIASIESNASPDTSPLEGVHQIENERRVISLEVDPVYQELTFGEAPRFTSPGGTTRRATTQSLLGPLKIYNPYEARTSDGEEFFGAQFDRLLLEHCDYRRPATPDEQAPLKVPARDLRDLQRVSPGFFWPRAILRSTIVLLLFCVIATTRLKLPQRVPRTRFRRIVNWLLRNAPAAIAIAAAVAIALSTRGYTALFVRLAEREFAQSPLVGALLCGGLVFSAGWLFFRRFMKAELWG